MNYIFVLPILVAALLLVFGGLALSHLVAPRHPGGVKNDTYECGEKTIGSSRVQFNVGYYLFGLVFLVFDVEAAFLFPWAMIVREAGVAGLITVFGFIAVLLVGFVYAWRKGVLEWE